MPLAQSKEGQAANKSSITHIVKSVTTTTVGFWHIANQYNVHLTWGIMVLFGPRHLPYIYSLQEW